MIYDETELQSSHFGRNEELKKERWVHEYATVINCVCLSVCIFVCMDGCICACERPICEQTCRFSSEFEVSQL